MGINIEKRNKQIKYTNLFFIIYYIVGAIGLLVSTTHPLFLMLTPLTLIINGVGLFAFHSTKNKVKEITVFISIYVIAFLIELIGVKTGLIFGSYQYGESLGPKIFDTPLLIGLNWLFLAYASKSILDNFFKKKWITFLVAPALLVIFDFVLEQVAPKLDMWYWQDSVAPVQNYIVWYVLSLIFVILLDIFKVDTRNSVAKVIFLCQFIFFIVLYIFL
jgi:putative membrane protein